MVLGTIDQTVTNVTVVFWSLKNKLRPRCLTYIPKIAMYYVLKPENLFQGPFSGFPFVSFPGCNLSKRFHPRRGDRKWYTHVHSLSIKSEPEKVRHQRTAPFFGIKWPIPRPTSHYESWLPRSNFFKSVGLSSDPSSILKPSSLVIQKK